MYYVYVLESQKDGKHYVGQTANLQVRLSQHNSGESRYTKNRGPWAIIYSEEYNTRSEAMRRERYLKTGVGRDFLKSLRE
jgi:putative endonuclease